MDLATSPEREALRVRTRAFLADRASEAATRNAMGSDTGYDAAVWADLLKAVPVVGGWSPDGVAGGGSFRDVAVVLEEAGRSLLCGPLLSTAVLAASVLDAVTDVHPPAAELRRRISEGGLVATVALSVAEPRVAVSGGDHRLTGTLPYVLDGHVAEIVLTAGELDGVPALFLVHTDAAGVERRPLTTMDQTRRFADVALHEAPADLVAVGDLVTAISRDVQALACIAVACEQIGGARRCVEMAVDYARTREQFGVPIGTFQAIKHSCANMLAAVEIATSTATYASWCVDADRAEMPMAAHLAKSLCSETYRGVAADTIQVHGGIGFTWNHPAHLYYKRAKSSEIFLGSPTAHRAELATLLGL